MPILDFKEIAPANASDGTQEQFELFAREFLELMRYRTVTPPDRGPDGGRDLIVEEVRSGPGGETRLRWLVSCKHFAHTGRSVGLSDEESIRDRVEAKKCQGFLAFYSSVASSGLAARLEELKQNGFEVQRFDRETIEAQLLRLREGIALAKRYFPVSMSDFIRENPPVADILVEAEDILCDYCGKNLLVPGQTTMSIIAFGENYPDVESDVENRPFRERVEFVYFSCKGNCDLKLERKYGKPHLITTWAELGDLCNPTWHLRYVLAWLDQMRSGVDYEQKAFEKEKKMLAATFLRVARSLTTEEREIVKRSLGMV